MLKPETLKRRASRNLLKLECKSSPSTAFRRRLQIMADLADAGALGSTWSASVGIWVNSGGPLPQAIRDAVRDDQLGQHVK